MVPAVEAKRFMRLLHELGEERENRYGWVSQAAQAIGVHRSTLHKVLKGERPVTRTLVTRAANGLRLPRAYFLASDDERHYRDWQEPQTTVTLDIHSAFPAVLLDPLRTSTRQMRQATDEGSEPDVRERARSVVTAAHAIPVVRAYAVLRQHLARSDSTDLEVEFAIGQLIQEAETLEIALQAALDRKSVD